MKKIILCFFLLSFSNFLIADEFEKSNNKWKEEITQNEKEEENIPSGKNLFYVNGNLIRIEHSKTRREIENTKKETDKNRERRTEEKNSTEQKITEIKN